MNWPLQDAKNDFSKVVQRARSEGPQTVTLRGERAAVV
ncbi:MAG: type II toxin-antitoxin system prevent-host-death family antitoxin, partial [Mesorhizobium sp.]